MNTQEIVGFLLVNKPPRITSLGCVKKIKRLLSKKTKIGHTGTLDDFASGLLIICIDRQATKLVDSLMNLDKKYKVRAKLGELRDTLDFTGEVVSEKDPSQITKEDLIKVINSLGSEYIQIPPAYSSLKHKGKPLYKLARTKKMDPEELEKIIQSKKRLIKLYNIELLEFKPPFFTIEAHVSKGTYIRSLVNDIAQKLDNVATTYELARTAIGPLSVNEAIDLERIDNLEMVQKHLISIEKMKEKITSTATKLWSTAKH